MILKITIDIKSIKQTLLRHLPRAVIARVVIDSIVAKTNENEAVILNVRVLRK